MTSKEDLFNYSINPWSSPDEFIEFYEILFPKNNNSLSFNEIQKNNNLLDSFIESLSIENLKKSMTYLIEWDSREDNKMFCLPIILLINTIIKLKEKKINNKDINSGHILAEIIIRVINIIMDQLRKTKKVTSMNMYLIAKNLQLPEFIIDIRHSCTHKNLPNFNELVFTIEYTFFWIKKKLIEPKYISYTKEKNYFMYLLNKLNNDENENNIEINIARLEPEHLMIIITQLFINFKKCFVYNKLKNTITYNNDKIKSKIQIYKEILDKEKEIFILMVFSFIYQQIQKINSNKKISIEEKEKYKQYIICFSKLIYNNTDKKIKFDIKKYEILYISIYNNLNQIKDEYKIIYEIFINTFQNSIKNINLEDNEIDEDNQYIILNKIEGNIKEIKIEYEKINEILNSGKNKDEEKNKMNIEENDNKENDFLNMDFKDNYKNFNSIII